MNLLIVLLLAITIAGEFVSYRDYKVYRVKPSSKEHLKLLHMFKNNTDVDFWTPVFQESLEPVNIMVGPYFQAEFEKTLFDHDIPFEITVDNAEEVFAEERKAQANATPRQTGTITFDRYYNYSEIQAYLHELVQEKPNLVSLENYGVSVEKRQLTLIHIPPSNNTEKPIIFIDGGMHGRDWISTAQVLYIIQTLVEHSTTEQWIHKLNVILIPVVNPDGYEFTHRKDRLWRKNRRLGRRCIGVDPNRNFPYNWRGPGGGSREYENTYAGEHSFSEPETEYFSHVIMKYSDRIKLYLSFHSSGSCILYPWSYTSSLPKEKGALHDIAFKAADNILAATDRKYTVGSAFNILGPAAGSSVDWAYVAAQVNLAYTVVLPAERDNTRFNIIPAHILGVCKETYAGMRIFFQHVIDKYHSKPDPFRAAVAKLQQPQNLLILDYLNDLVKFKWVRVKSYGKSYEKRQLKLVEISNGGGSSHPVIFIDGGMHGLEWISVAQVLYIIHSIVEKPENEKLLDDTDWVLIPVVNPDGYEFSRRTDRRWRKTRSAGMKCIGADINRNFPYHWSGPGTSYDECDDAYGGTAPLSEIEAKHLTEAFASYKNRIKLYISFHSPEQSILYPWGFTAELPKDAHELHELGVSVGRSIAAIQGTAYKIGTTYNVLGPLSGSSRDWIYGFLEVKLAFNIHLRSGNDILKDSDRIMTVVGEMFQGIKQFHAHIADLKRASSGQLILISKAEWVYWFSSIVVSKYFLV